MSTQKENSSNNKNYRWFIYIAGLFVTALIISNIIAVKIISIKGIFLPAGVILFPITYIIGDVLTEVYGYARARQVIWIGFFCNLMAVLAILAAGMIPAAPFWRAGYLDSPVEAQRAFDAILGFTPRLLLASFIAYLIGEFLNSFVLAKLKIKTKGRYLWMRTISSTIVGQAADSAIFTTIAFFDVMSTQALMVTILSQWFFKVGYEIFATPITYLVVNRLKRSEKVDYYDTETDFSPIAVLEK